MPDDTPGQGPHYLRPAGVDLFPGGQGPTGPGGVLSVVTLDVGDANAVVAELIPLQPGSASYTLLDSKDKGAGFSPVLDAGYSPGTSQAATTKAAVNGPRRYVRALLVVTSGIWTITGTPVYQPSNANVTASITGTVAANQGTPNAGGAAAWPVQAADGALATEGAQADAAWDGSAATASIVAILKAVYGRVAGALPVVRGTGASTSLTTAILTGTADAQLIAAPGPGAAIYVFSLAVSNTSGTLTRLDLKEGSGGTVRHSMALAASGGGYVHQLGGAWKLPANTGLYGALSAAASDVRASVEYLVGA